MLGDGYRPRRRRGLTRGKGGSVQAVDVRRLTADERADLAEFLATLSTQQWQAPTLCTRWRVREVVAHIISYDNLDARARAHRARSGGPVPARSP
jgi:hypothetical protein